MNEKKSGPRAEKQRVSRGEVKVEKDTLKVRHEGGVVIQGAGLDDC